MRRHAVGIFALGLFAAAAALWIWAPQQGVVYQFEANFLRVGALLAVLWLAYWDLKRIPPWLWGVFLLMLAVVIVKPRSLIFIVPIALLLGMLHPRVWSSGRNRHR